MKKPKHVHAGIQSLSAYTTQIPNRTPDISSDVRLYVSSGDPWKSACQPIVGIDLQAKVDGADGARWVGSYCESLYSVNEAPVFETWG